MNCMLHKISVSQRFLSHSTFSDIRKLRGTPKRSAVWWGAVAQSLSVDRGGTGTGQQPTPGFD